MTEPDQQITAFERSEAGKILLNLATTSQIEQIDELDKDTVELMTLEVRALIARIRVLPEIDEDQIERPEISPKLQGIIDIDLLNGISIELNPTLEELNERNETLERLSELIQNPQILENYQKLFNQVYDEIHLAKMIVDLYWNDSSLNPVERTAAVRQLSRLLNTLVKRCEEEIQNVHNQVAREKRGYRSSDKLIVDKLKKYKQQCINQLTEIKQSDVEVQIQLRMDEIKLDRDVLAKRVSQDVLKRYLGLKGKGFIVTPSRAKLLFGTENKPDQSIIAALRKGHNVELFGPTGTGKTKLAEYAAELFSGKPAIVVPGNPGLSKYDLFGKPTGLDKRDEGALIKCLKEGRVLIIDEDNRVDPRVLSVIKHSLGLNVGDIFIHPETGEEISIPAGFGIVVTRNEKGKHHKDRHELPPEYRREFTHGSFEVGYFPKEEIYDRFLVPKLCKDDGSMDLSEDDVGGEMNDASKRSPLLGLVIAAEKIQKLYKENKIKDGVFESGFLIKVFDDWHEQHIQTECSFIDYLETRLITFVKRPIGNPARKKIIEVLVEQGFFVAKNATDFVTQDEGESITQAELDNLRGNAVSAFATAKNANSTPLIEFFKADSSSPSVEIIRINNSPPTLDARGVAILDPFEQREIGEVVHVLDEKIRSFKIKYLFYCKDFGLKPNSFSAHNFKIKKPAIVEQFVRFVDGSDIENMETVKALLNSYKNMDDEEFLESFGDMMKSIQDGINPASVDTREWGE